MASSDLQASPFRLSAASAEPPDRKAGLGWQAQLLIFIIAAAAVVARRPDALLNPQFFGEDGSVWYQNAYVLGWFHSLFLSQNGYFQTLPRLAASLALLFPLHYAPLVMNLIGITFQVLPANILLSWRCEKWGPISARAVMATIYIALPNSAELNASVEEGQWHLALIASMLVLARVPYKKLGWQIFDLVIILLSGVTGPFCILLLPVAVIFWWFRREPFRLAVIGVLAISAAIQLTAILQTAAGTRPRVGLGATPKLLIELLGGHVYLGAILGQNGLHEHGDIALLSIVTVLATALLIYCAVKATLEIRLFILFAVLVCAASLRSPMVSWTVPAWQELEAAGALRYWFFPMLAFAWAMVTCAREGNHGAIRIAAVSGLMCMTIGMIRDWSYPEYPDLHFPEYAKRFDMAAPGSAVAIPIFPVGWTLQLTKKSPFCKNYPVGFIDLPAHNAQLSGPTPAMGWVAGGSPVQQVTLLVDHVPVQSTTLSVKRPEVDKLYPKSPDEEKGWSTTLDVSKTSPGQHELEARSHEANGCEADFSVLTFVRVK